MPCGEAGLCAGLVKLLLPRVPAEGSASALKQESASVLERQLTMPGEPAACRYYQHIWYEEAAKAGSSVWLQLRRTMMVWGQE